jgi:hypothetical protein
MRTAAFAAAFAGLLSCQSPAPEPTKMPADPASAPKQEPELGLVRWQRSFPAAEALAKQQQRPLFVLFQEIPGCSTCTDFGKAVLGQPLLVAAIEQAFVPVVVRNNVDGDEAKVRDAYREPAWNNPVVRFLDPAGKDLIPRRDGIYTAHGIAGRMIEALTANKQPVPGYLRLAHAEADPQTATAVFQMHCFWEGEAALGALDGVVHTRSAFQGAAEVVEVVYRPALLAKVALEQHAQTKSCQPVRSEGVRLAPASDQQHALRGTPYDKLELTPMQRTKVHAALQLGTDARTWLTPAQIAALTRN